MGINEYLESHNVSPTDIGPFLMIHTILSAALVGSTWWLCYWGSGRTAAAAATLPSSSAATQLFKNNPQQQHMPQSMLLNSLISMPMISDGIKRRATSALLTLEKASRNSQPVQYLERQIPSLDATRVCVSFAEAKFGRLFFKPITIPARIWISWKGTRAWKQLNNTKSSSGTTSSTITSTGGSNKYQSCSGVDGDAKSRIAFVKGVSGGRDAHVPIISSTTTSITTTASIGRRSNAIFLRECNDFRMGTNIT